MEPGPLPAPISSIETRSSWLVAAVSVALLATSFGALWITSVGLKAIAADLGGARTIPSLASSLGWFGTGIGGILMGRVAERFGIRWSVMTGAVSIAIGLYLSTRGEEWQLYLGHGLFIGVFGNGGLNAPLYVYISRWFDLHRGSALALLASSPFLAGAVWPPIFEPAISAFGWRSTMLAYAAFALVVMLPLAALFLHAAPEPTGGKAGAGREDRVGRTFAWPPNVVFAILATASFMCCVTMSMPQAHLVALCSDLGIAASHGAAMLSLLLAIGFFSRQAWGAISDRIGALRTVLASSALQALAMTAFVVTQDEAGLFAVSGAFGLGFSALTPAYVLAIREYFPAHEASWRVPTLLLMTGSGMAVGTWLAGAMYDSFGHYAPAFAAGVGFNLINLALIALLLLRKQTVSARMIMRPAE